MIDENAFGLYVGLASFDEDEYALEPEALTQRLAAFHAALHELVTDSPIGEGAFAVDLGHAFYVEVGDGDQSTDPVDWLRSAKAQLTGRELETVCVLTHGGRWVPGEQDVVRPAAIGELAVFRLPGPSEPLRRALHAASAAVLQSAGEEDEDDDATLGWGPGLYLDTEALDALGKKLKNAPTPLASGGATFFRIGR